MVTMEFLDCQQLRSDDYMTELISILHCMTESRKCDVGGQALLSAFLVVLGGSR